MDAVEELRTIEEICQVKYRYHRCVDAKLWDEIGDIFTADATVDYGTMAYGKPVRISGRDEIVTFLSAKMGPDVISVHAASQPEIAVTGDSAAAVWGLRETMIATTHRIVIMGAAFCHDRCERCADGRWRIAHTGYTWTYEAMMSLDDLPSFTITSRG
jgi:hypothetical protein